jgi:transcriptional regulator with XRE-family HTH domain
MKSGMTTIHNDEYRDLVRILTDLRRSAGVSQKSLSELLGLEQPDVSKVENFERRLDVLEMMLWLSAVAPERYNAVNRALRGTGGESGQ